MRKRVAIIVVALLVGAAGSYWIYLLSPFGRHDREAAAYERNVHARVMSVGDVEIVSENHQVTWAGGNDDITLMLATFKVRTPMQKPAFEERLKEVLADGDTSYGIRELEDQNGYRLFQVRAETLG